MSEQLDAQGEAHEALSSVVADYGQRVLSDPRMIGSLVGDLLPDLPRERSLLVTAAEADVAGELTQRVQEQHLDADTALQLVARTLIDRKSIDPAASTWVTTEYAQALGYPVRPGAQAAPPPFRETAPPPPPPPPPVFGPPPPPTVTNYAGYASPNPQTAPPPDPTAVPAGGYGWYSSPSPPAGGQAPTGIPPQAPPPWAAGGGGGGPTPTPKRRNRGLIYGGGAAAAAIVIFVVAAFAGGLFKSTPKPKPTPPPSPHPTVHPTPISTGLRLAPGVATLVQLLPSDVNPANCKAAPKPGWATPGLVKSLECYDSGVGSGGVVYAYQMNSSANYQASWANFNTWWGFSPPSGSGCPPSGSNTQGSVPWDDTGSGGHAYYPTAVGQTLECGLFSSTSNQPEPTYAWSFPSEDAYIIAIGDPDTSFSHLQSWWASNSEPNASPSPAAP